MRTLSKLLAFVAAGSLLVSMAVAQAPTRDYAPSPQEAHRGFCLITGTKLAES